MASDHVARPARPADSTRHPGRLTALAAVGGLLTTLFLGVLAIPASASQPGPHASATVPAGPGASGADRPAAAARHTNAGGSLAFAALCVVGIVLVGGGVLLYTARTRRELPTNAQ